MNPALRANSRHSTIIKICGITRVEDGLAAVEAGADWLGFIRWPGSKRFRPSGECAATLREIRAAAGRTFEAVGVYVDQEKKLIEGEIEAAGFDRVQLHGSEPRSLVEAMPVPALKAIRIRDAASLDQAEQYPGIDLLADADVPGLPGGTGRVYDWGLLEGLARRRRIVVAGGLRPESVAEVIRRLRPYGVDVSSGVERAPGVKDRGKLRAFIAAAREVEFAA